MSLELNLSESPSSSRYLPRASDHPNFGYRLWKRLDGVPDDVCINFINNLTAIHCLLHVDDHMWGGCVDGRLAVWHVLTGKLIGFRQAHKLRIFTIIDDGDKVLTASDDNSIKVWSRSVTFITELNFGRISCLFLYEKEIWCGSDEQLCIFVIDRSKIELNVPVRCLYVDNEFIWVGCEKNILRICQETNKQISINSSRVNMFISVQDSIWSCNSEGIICIINKQTGKIETSIEENATKKKVYTLAAHGDYVWSGGLDKKMKIWNAKTRGLVSVLPDNDDMITSIVIVAVVLPIQDKRSNSSKDKSLKNSQTNPTQWCKVNTVWTSAAKGSIAVWV